MKLAFLDRDVIMLKLKKVISTYYIDAGASLQYLLHVGQRIWPHMLSINDSLPCETCLRGIVLVVFIIFDRSLDDYI